MDHKIHWGILGTGRIARRFALGLHSLSDARLVAVGSRSSRAAEQFGAEFRVPHCYPTYEELVRDPEVDVIYVATPHSLHKENTLLALGAGKVVLCEKPFTINAREAAEVIAFARTRKLFLMEAMWTRCFPLMARLRELLAQQAIGELRMLTADFGFRAGYEEEPRLFDRALGGGSLLDVGVYPVSLASMLFGRPQGVNSLAHLGPTGVDEAAAIVLSHPQGQLAVLSSAVRVDTAQEAVLYGTHGRIRIHPPWWRPTAMTLSVEGLAEELLEFPLVGNGYQYEAAEAMKCLRAGKHESELIPLEETHQVMQTLDAIRYQWGLKYPTD